MEEEWEEIPEFPGYSVSTFGRIWNNNRNKEVQTSVSNWGNVKVSFGPERATRSVAKLVAEAFVEPPDDLSDCLIFYDGNQRNVRADNIAWRPRQFAFYYSRQMRRGQPVHFRNLPIENIDLHIEYDSVVQAGMTEGVLFEDIWDSTYLGRRPYPFHYKYRIADRAFDEDWEPTLDPIRRK